MTQVLWFLRKALMRPVWELVRMLFAPLWFMYVFVMPPGMYFTHLPLSLAGAAAIVGFLTPMFRNEEQVIFAVMIWLGMYCLARAAELYHDRKQRQPSLERLLWIPGVRRVKRDRLHYTLLPPNRPSPLPPG